MKPRVSIFLIVPLLTMLVWSVFGWNGSRGPTLDSATAALNDFTLNESTLHRDLLSARSGLLRNYDSVNRTETRLAAALVRLQQTGITGDVGEQLRALSVRQEDLVETFKSNNAVLQNALAYFNLFTSRLQASSAPDSLIRSVNNLSAAMLQLTLDTSADAIQSVDHQFELFSAQTTSVAISDTVSALLAYGRLLRDRLPATDAVLKEILRLPAAAQEAKASELIAEAQQAERQRASQFRVLLYATALLLVAEVVHLGIQLQRRRVVARRRAAFERAVASLSVRFISSADGELSSLVSLALAELAGLADADRAYFLTIGESPQTCTWATLGVTYPPGWPQDAVALARRSLPREHGVIHIQDRRMLRDEHTQQRLAEAGVHRWTCITTNPRDGMVCVLGLDCLRADRSGNATELRLLRMAFDAVANAVTRDILTRDRARLEQFVQRAQQMQTIAALTGGVAHNFNNIVGTILGYAEMIDETSAPEPRLVQQVAGIRQAGERARTLVEQILSYGRKRDVRPGTVDMQALVTETIAQLARTLPRAVRIVFDRAPDHEVWVRGEPAQLEQVVVNLCANAAQAMEYQGTVIVALDTPALTQDLRFSHGRLAAGRYLRMIVSDQGCGMDPGTLDRIFEPFFTTRPDGNGLGLATVRNIVQEHGGALHVESTAGSGSRFEVWLPPAQDPVAAESDSQAFGNGETVLLFGNDPARQLHDEEIVAALGYEPVGFYHLDHMRAIVKGAPSRFEIAVIALCDPVARDKAVAFLKHTVPGIRIIVIVATRNAMDAGHLAAIQGCDVVADPVTSDKLAAALRRAVESRDLTRYQIEPT
jgi:signal transduction histidine kinase